MARTSATKVKARARTKAPAVSRAKKSSKAGGQGPKGERLYPAAGGVVVRMYRHGLGDCFLLAFATDDPAALRYVLIDCGVHSRQDHGPARLEQVMRDVGDATGGHLHVVV